jgi:hypothetical protein
VFDVILKFAATLGQFRGHDVNPGRRILPARWGISDRLAEDKFMGHVLADLAEPLDSFLRFLFSLLLAHGDAFIVLCKYKEPFLRLVEAHPVR